MPDVTKYVHQFGTNWQLWYIGLQPQWRIHENSADISTLARDPPDNAALSDWDEIRKGSPNGFFVLLLALGWWGVGACDQGDEEMERWADAFDDLRWALEFMLNEGDEDEVDEDEGKQTIPAKRAAAGDDRPVSKR